MTAHRMRRGRAIAYAASVSWLVTLGCLLAPMPHARAAAAKEGTPGVGMGAGSGIAWAQSKFVYQANGKRLAEVLQDFAASQGLPATIAEGVDGVVHGSFEAAPEAFLNAMNKAYGVVWYHDGTALFFYPARAMQSRLFRLKGFRRTQVEGLLASLNLGDPRFPLRFNEREKTMLAYGPPRHIELISSALESLDSGVIENNRLVVQVFQLKYASAADRMLGKTNVPGIVSTLRSIYGGALNAAEGATGPRPAENKMVNKVQQMRSVYGDTRMMPELNRPNSGDNPGALALPGSVPSQSSQGGAARGLRSPVSDDDMPWFEADEANNSVIVRGHQRNMAEYGALIRRIDRRPTLIELEATIIDIASDKVDSLGIDWSTGGSKGSLGVSGVKPGLPGNDGSSSPGGFTVSTVWSNAGRQLLTRIEALQAQGSARIVATPKVMGVANRPAVMQEKRSAAVRVAGNLDAQLYTIEAGTTLEVTPQVVEVDGVARMKLTLYIEDGHFEPRLVDNVPVVKRTEIRTEAHVVEGESLLIGGISVDTDANNASGVPGVSKVPLLGGLFRWDGARATHSERLFLITPKLVRDIERLPVASSPSAPAPVPATSPSRAAPAPVAVAAPAPVPMPAPATPAQATVQAIAAAPVPVRVTAPAPQPAAPAPAMQSATMQSAAAPARVVISPLPPAQPAAKPAELPRQPYRGYSPEERARLFGQAPPKAPAPEPAEAPSASRAELHAKALAIAQAKTRQRSGKKPKHGTAAQGTQPTPVRDPAPTPAPAPATTVAALPAVLPPPSELPAPRAGARQR